MCCIAGGAATHGDSSICVLVFVLVAFCIITPDPSPGLQIEYSLVKRGPESSGLLAKCADLGVTPIAHSPLAQGLLTDFAVERDDDKAAAVKPILQLLQFIGALSGGKSIEQAFPFLAV